MQILTIFGTRPEIIKMSQLIPLLDKNFDHQYIFTSQHYSKFMVDVFLENLKIRQPDIYLGLKSSDYNDIINGLLPKIKELNPEYILVYGDTNSTLSAAIAGKKLGKKLIHVEAGLRAFDNELPEERNRIETDKMADLLFAPTKLNEQFLKIENITKNIFVVGNTVVDACLKFSKIAQKSNILDKLNVTKNEYILLTAHRQESVDNPERLLKILSGIESLPKKVVFPIHPRTKKRILENNYRLPGNVIEIDPVDYLDFLKLLKNCFLVITDSGGIQEEAITLKIPCLTIRNSTERWETVINGGNYLVGIEPKLVSYYVNMIINSELDTQMRNAKNPYGNGDTSIIIAKKLAELNE